MAMAVRGCPPRHPHSLRTTTRGSLNHDGNRHRGRLGAQGHLRSRPARRQARRRFRASSRPAARCRFSPASCCAPTAMSLELAATDMELSLRTTLAAQVEGDSAVVVPGKLLVDLARLLPAVGGHDRVPAGGRRRSHLERQLLVEAERLRRRGLPAASVGRPRAAHDRDRVAARDRRPGRALRLEGRVTAGADGDPGPVRGHAAVDGRDGLVPALVQGDASSSRRAPTSRRSSRPARSPSSRGSRPAPRPSSSGVNENTVVFGTGDTWLTTRRIDGQFPDVGRLLPESFEIEVDLPRAELRDVVAPRRA